MRLLDYVQPDPSSFKFDKAANTVCIRHGEPRNADCRSDPANAKRNRGGWNFLDEKDMEAALSNSYQVGGPVGCAVWMGLCEVHWRG